MSLLFCENWERDLKGASGALPGKCPSADTLFLTFFCLLCCTHLDPHMLSLELLW